MFKTFLADPMWMRLGFTEPPDETTAGKGVGIVIIDDVINHPYTRHLSGRLKRISVDKDFNVTCKDVVLEGTEALAPYKKRAEHGMMSLFLLSHLAFEIGEKTYVGIVPAATFFIIPHIEPEKIKKGIEWIIKKSEQWNVRIVLSTICPQGVGFIRNTREDPYVQALMPAVEAGLLVVSANGNSATLNNYHPIDFFAVGGYDDDGSADLSKHKPHPLSSWGINGDGHMRPDILAPFTYLPAPYYESKKSDLYSKFYDESKSDIRLSYFGGTSGASTLIAGICTYLFSLYPHLTNDTVKSALIQHGLTLKGTDNPAPIVNVRQTIEAICSNCEIPLLPVYPESIIIRNPTKELLSSNDIKRGMALTILINQGDCNREMLWRYVNDESPRVKKVAIWALQKPLDSEEKKTVLGIL